MEIRKKDVLIRAIIFFLCVCVCVCLLSVQLYITNFFVVNHLSYFVCLFVFLFVVLFLFSLAHLFFLFIDSNSMARTLKNEITIFVIELVKGKREGCMIIVLWGEPTSTL